MGKISNTLDFNKYQCAIFDLDGTLINSTGVWSRVDDEFFSRRGLVMPEAFPQEIKTHTLYSGAVYLINELSLDETPEAIVKEWRDAARKAYTEEVRLKPNVHEFISMLKERYGYRIGLATSNNREVYEGCLRNNRIYDYFDSFTEADEVERRKGFPDIYELAAARMDVAVDECIVFEDVYEAVRGSKLGGFFTVAVADEASLKDKERIVEAADMYIEGYAELLGMAGYK